MHVHSAVHYVNMHVCMYRTNESGFMQYFLLETEIGRTYVQADDTYQVHTSCR